MTPLAMKEASPHYCQIMVAKRKRVDRLIAKAQHTRRCPPPVPPQRGHARIPTKKINFLVCWLYGLSKPTDDVGQQSNDKIKVRFSQSIKIQK